MRGMISLTAVLFAAAAAIQTIRLFLYKRQIRHMMEELSMMRQGDTNYRLSSYCRIGETQKVIGLMNEIIESCRTGMESLRRENRAYKESITSISHDIRTPLTSAKGYLQLLCGTPLSAEKQKEYLKTVERRVDDVTDMLGQLFEYARLEAGEMELEMKKINLTNIYMDTLSMFYDDFTRKGCEPKIEVIKTPCYIFADRHALVRIIENLIKNALVHGTGDYKFGLERKEGKVCLAVSNRTDSIEQKDIDRIFDRFYTTDTSRARKTTGLGLAIVKQFTDRMGGAAFAALEENIFMVEICFPDISDEKRSFGTDAL